MPGIGVYMALAILAGILVGVFALLFWITGGPVVPLAVFFVAICVFMMLVILIQKPKGGGLSGAFGGAGQGIQTAFGSKVGDVLTWVTVVFFVAFLALAMALTWTIHPENVEDVIESAPIGTGSGTVPDAGLDPEVELPGGQEEDTAAPDAAGAAGAAVTPAADAPADDTDAAEEAAP
jgi:preprotein translocase subunit SecG